MKAVRIWNNSLRVMPERTHQRHMKGLTRLVEGPSQIGSHKFGDVIFLLTMSVPFMSLLLFFTIHKVERVVSNCIPLPLSTLSIVILGNKFPDSWPLKAQLSSLPLKANHLRIVLVY